MDLELTGKRALVTGGSRGIGKAVARELAREGANVVIAARDQGRIDAGDVAHVVTFLASPKSVAINGDTIAAGGGVPGGIYY